jgi:serine/threonine-protein kinase
MQKIALPQGEWFYDPAAPLGPPGGFGTVFEGYSDLYGALAVKRLHLTASEAAHREMRMAQDLAGRHFDHVISVFDAGEDAQTGGYFVVMPKAERSLQTEIERVGTFPDTAAVPILLEIVAGLLEVQDIVHRDLKPGNVLFHDSRWKIADFGIARFLEDSTSLQTLKGIAVLRGTRAVALRTRYV